MSCTAAWNLPKELFCSCLVIDTPSRRGENFLGAGFLSLAALAARLDVEVFILEKLQVVSTGSETCLLADQSK